MCFLLEHGIMPAFWKQVVLFIFEWTEMSIWFFLPLIKDNLIYYSWHILKDAVAFRKNTTRQIFGVVWTEWLTIHTLRILLVRKIVQVIENTRHTPKFNNFHNNFFVHLLLYVFLATFSLRLHFFKTLFPNKMPKLYNASIDNSMFTYFFFLSVSSRLSLLTHSTLHFICTWYIRDCDAHRTPVTRV